MKLTELSACTAASSTTLTVSFQFHHTQMDGAHAAAFLDALQREIDRLPLVCTF